MTEQFSPSASRSTMTDRTDQTDKDNRRKLWGLLVLLLLITLVVIVAFVLWPTHEDENKPDGAPPPAAKTHPSIGGEKFAYSAFYHATDGEWTISDEGILVLKERKFITESEVDRYSVHKITGADLVEIIESSRRWKRCRISRDGKQIAEGWIDANFVRNVERVEDNE